MFPVIVYNFGCKLNQLEGEAIADSFKKAGFNLLPASQKIAGPGIIIINTCTVTSKADQKARRFIRSALRENPSSCVIAAGCYAGLDKPEVEAIESEFSSGGVKRLFVPGQAETKDGGTGLVKSSLLSLPTYLQKAASCEKKLSQILETFFKNAIGDSPFAFRPEEFSSHSRGYLKIQDGCDSRCAYCRVPLARGAAISLPAKDALDRLLFFEEKGCAEIMITGVNVTQYNDPGLRKGLADLLKYLLDGSRKIALRVASLEPDGIDKTLASVLAHERIRPHFHLSIQSGSDSVLKRMGRLYDSRQAAAAAALLRSVKDDPFLACDIIAGFPGETAEEFEQTFSFCEKNRFAWIHAFPFSKRAGTAAFSFPNPVCDRDKTQRVRSLVKLALQGRRDYAARWIGKEISAVAEKGEDEAPGGKKNFLRAVSENYLKLLIECPGESPPPGSALYCVPVSLGDADGVRPDATARLKI